MNDPVSLYTSGVTVQQVADHMSWPYSRTRTFLVRHGVELRQRVKPRTPVAVPVKCRDCGERLDRPHVLGAHLPGCTAGHVGTHEQENADG